MLFNDIPEKEVTCEGMGKCPFATRPEGVTEDDLKYAPTEDTCTFKRKLCIICYKENEEDREPEIKRFKDRYKCNTVDASSEMIGMRRYWDFVEQR